MKDDRKVPIPEEIFEHDELDDVVIAADATGMLASEKLITEAELLEAQRKAEEAAKRR